MATLATIAEEPSKELSIIWITSRGWDSMLFGYLLFLPIIKVHLHLQNFFYSDKIRFNIDIMIGGYHGYWQTNIYEVNPNFGTADDLKRLVEECHKRGIWVMLDVVGNHVGMKLDVLKKSNLVQGPVGYSYNDVVPFKFAFQYLHCLSIQSNKSLP